MKANFDDHAINYDAYFSNSLIGKAQRERVHYFLNKQLEKKKKNLRVLYLKFKPTWIPGIMIVLPL